MQCRNLGNFVHPTSPALSFQPALTNNTSMQSTTKPWSPVPSGTERVHDQGAGTGQQGLRAGGAKNLWINMSRRKRVSRLKIATYNIRTLLRDERIQKHEEDDHRNVSLPNKAVTYYTMANNGRAGVGFLIKRKWKGHIVMVNSISHRVAELVLCIAKRYKLKIVRQQHHTQKKTQIASTTTAMRL